MWSFYVEITQGTYVRICVQLELSQLSLESSEMMGHQIFLSHAAADKELVDKFIDFIQTGLNVDPETVYCTSNQSIPTGNNFIDNIKDNIADTKLVVFLMTRSYFKSPFCLCEMGAAWALNHDIYPILVLPMRYEDLKRTPLIATNAILANESSDLDKLRDEFVSKGLAKAYNTARFNEKKHDFLSFVDEFTKSITGIDEGNNELVRVNQSPRESVLDATVAKLKQRIQEITDNRPKPYFTLSVNPGEDKLRLGIRNVGEAAGIIKLVSVRNDLSINTTFRPTQVSGSSLLGNTDQLMVDFVIGQRESYEFDFPYDANFSFHEREWISSISIFYADDVNRAYRSRIAYLWGVSAGKHRITNDLVKESFVISQLPDFDPLATDIRRITELEMKRAVVYIPSYRLYHFAQNMELLTNSVLDGIPFTGSLGITVREIEFNWTGEPIFHAQIMGLIPFKLILTSNNYGTEQCQIFDSTETSYHGHRYAGLVEERDYAEYGLVPKGNDEPNLRRLFHHIDTSLRRRMREIRGAFNG